MSRSAADLSLSSVPIDSVRQVIAGQTVSLSAGNFAPGTTVDFEINQTVLARVTAAPYAMLFTVPEGISELLFRIVIRDPDATERASAITRLTVAPDEGATVSGRIAEGTKGVSLELAAAGLFAEYFPLDAPVTALPVLAGRVPARASYVTAINQPNPHALFGDDPLGTNLTNDYAARFTGELWVETAGTHQFWLSARSGAALSLDGKPLTDTGFTSGEPVEATANLTLARGWHKLEATYYHAVGAASVRLEWQQPGDVARGVISPNVLRTPLKNSATVSESEGRFNFTQVPARLDTVWIRVRQGDTVTELPAVKPGTKDIAISIR